MSSRLGWVTSEGKWGKNLESQLRKVTVLQTRGHKFWSLAAMLVSTWVGSTDRPDPKIPCIASLAYLLSSRPQKACLKNEQTMQHWPKNNVQSWPPACTQVHLQTHTQSNFPTAQLKIKVTEDSRPCEPSKEELFESCKSKHCIRTGLSRDESCHPVRKGYGVSPSNPVMDHLLSFMVCF